ncbi:sulfurtransferase [Olivibacter jilunii]|uniref:sulfurtransferase n=1 Tax=Olivibacter jilunii TaxID=985016 RepID=UPI003F1570AD
MSSTHIQQSPLIDIYTLKDQLNAEKFLILDATNKPGAYDCYLQAHLPGALFVDLEQQLSEPSGFQANGGRHPLPTPTAFANTLGQLGISPSTHVVVYDDSYSTNAAARFWWMLRALGHKRVQVLDGGMAAIRRAGMALHAGKEQPKPCNPYPQKEWTLPLANLEEVKQASIDHSQLIIDVRSPERYHGLSEPIDQKAGHIPGAINIPLASNLDLNGNFIDCEAIRKKYEEAMAQQKPSTTIVHCGSGVTACHTLLAFDYAGLVMPKLFVGSWSEWSSNDLPVAN